MPTWQVLVLLLRHRAIVCTGGVFPSSVFSLLLITSYDPNPPTVSA